MKKAVQYLLLAGTLMPLILLLCPFAQWGEAASLLLRVIAALCAQALFCILTLPKAL